MGILRGKPVWLSGLHDFVPVHIYSAQPGVVLKFLNSGQFTLCAGVHESSAMYNFYTHFPNSLLSLNFQPGMCPKDWEFQPGHSSATLSLATLSSAPDSTVGHTFVDPGPRILLPMNLLDSLYCSV